LELERLIKAIEKLREELHLMFQEKANFQDDKLIEKSRKLDKMLNELCEYINNMEKE